MISAIQFVLYQEDRAQHVWRLESGIGMVKTMKLGGWMDVKSFQHYVRLAGVEIEGATNGFNLIPMPMQTASVHQLRSGEND